MTLTVRGAPLTVLSLCSLRVHYCPPFSGHRHEACPDFSFSMQIEKNFSMTLFEPARKVTETGLADLRKFPGN